MTKRPELTFGEIQKMLQEIDEAVEKLEHFGLKPSKEEKCIFPEVS